MSDRWWAQRYESLASIDPAFAGSLDLYAEQQVDLLEQLVELSANAQVLDVGCGGGRHAILLQERGYRVTGVDLAEGVLELARQRWDERHRGQPGPVFMAGDMRALPVQEDFDAAIMMDIALGVFSDEADNLIALTEVADRLRPGGRLLLELYNPYFWAHRTVTSHLPPGALASDVDLVRTYRFDPVRGRVEDSVVVFERGERRELPTQSLRAWTPPEIIALVQAAGFRRAEVFGTEGWSVPERPTRLNAKTSAFMWILATL
jgi:SAM-dependent methyltransferase